MLNMFIFLIKRDNRGLCYITPKMQIVHCYSCGGMLMPHALFYKIMTCAYVNKLRGNHVKIIMFQYTVNNEPLYVQNSRRSYKSSLFI